MGGGAVREGRLPANDARVQALAPVEAVAARAVVSVDPGGPAILCAGPRAVLFALRDCARSGALTCEGPRPRTQVLHVSLAARPFSGPPCAGVRTSSRGECVTWTQEAVLA